MERAMHPSSHMCQCKALMLEPSAVCHQHACVICIPFRMQPMGFSVAMIQEATNCDWIVDTLRRGGAGCAPTASRGPWHLPGASILRLKGRCLTAFATQRAHPRTRSSERP